MAEKYGKNENAVRGGIFQYKKAHVDGGGADNVSPSQPSQRQPATVDDYVANARKALEAARDLIDQEVHEAKASAGRRPGAL